MTNPIFLADQELLKGITLLLRGSRVLEAHIQTDLSPLQVYVLGSVNIHPLCRVGELAQITALSDASLARLLADLHKQGYLHTHVDQDDKRIKRLSLSTRGKQSYTQYQEESMKLMFSAYRQAGSDAVDGFVRVLWAIAQSHRP